MRKTSMAAMVLLLMTIACSKPFDPWPGPGHGHPGGDGNSSDKQYALRLDVRNLTSQPDFSNDSAQSVLNYLYFRLEGGDNVTHVIRQIRGDSSFGRLLDSVPAGTYRVSLVASHDSLPETTDNQGTRYFVHLPGADLFGKYYELKVSGTANDTVTLSRLVGKVRVVITDALPNTASKLILLQERPANLLDGNVYPQSLSAMLDIIYGNAPTYASMDIPGAALGTTHFTRDVYLLTQDSSRMTMSVHVQDANAHVIGGGSLDGVKVYRNRVTRLDATLFSGDTTVTVQYPVDTAFENAGHP